MNIIEKINNLTELEKKILVSAQKEFEAKGFYQTNVDNIALSLDIGKGTIYRHFGNKLSLFASVVIYVFQVAKEPIYQVESMNSFEDKFEFFITQAIKMNYSTGRLFRLFMEEEVHFREEIYKNEDMKQIYQYFMTGKNNIVVILKEIIDQGIKEKKIVENINSLVCAEITIMTINHFHQSYHSYCNIYKSLGVKKPFSIEAATDEIQNYIYRAFGYKGKGVKDEI